LWPIITKQRKGKDLEGSKAYLRGSRTQELSQCSARFKNAGTYYNKLATDLIETNREARMLLVLAAGIAGNKIRTDIILLLRMKFAAVVL
jgi:hypothetical protein